MAVIKSLCCAGSGGSFLHDDYSHISRVQINLAIDIKSVDGRRCEDCAGSEGENLIIVTESFCVWEEEIVREMVFQIRIEGV